MSNKLFTNVKFNNTSTRETERIMNSLKLQVIWLWWNLYKNLKASASFISSPLNYICNKSILSGIFPTRLKYSILKLVFKKRTRIMWPISLLTYFSEVFEKIIFDTLIKHIQINNILVEEQFGFRTSCKSIAKILIALNNKIMAGGIFCDLQKAFDC